MIYKHRQSLHKHKKKCEKKTDPKELVNKGTINSAMVNSNNKTFNNNNMNVDGDVKVVRFGNENLSYMTDDVYKQILGRGLRSVQEFIQHSNFHPDHPENHNIYIANIRDEFVVIFDGFKWFITDRDEKMEDIIYARSDYLNIKFEELKGDMDPRDVLKFENFMKRRDDDDVLRKIKGELTLQFYNNRYLPQRIRKKMELLEARQLRDEVDNICNNRKNNTIQQINMMLDIFGGEGADEIRKLISTL